MRVVLTTYASQLRVEEAIRGDASRSGYLMSNSCADAWVSLSPICGLIREIDVCLHHPGAIPVPVPRAQLVALALERADAWALDDAAPESAGAAVIRIFLDSIDSRDAIAAKAGLDVLLTAASCGEWSSSLSSAAGDAFSTATVAALIFARIGEVDAATLEKETLATLPSAGVVGLGVVGGAPGAPRAATTAPRSMGSVTFASSRDADQTRSGSLGTAKGGSALPAPLGGGGGGTEWLYESTVSVAPLRRYGPTPVDESRALRGVLAWASRAAPGARTAVEAATWTLLRSAGSGIPTRSGSLRAAFDISVALTSSSIFAPSDDSSAACLLAALKPLLQGAAGSLVEDSWEQLSSLVARAAAPSTVTLANAAAVVSSSLAMALLESSTRAALLLAQLCVLVAASPHTLLALALPPLKVALASDNSLLAQTSRSWFQDEGITRAVAVDANMLAGVLAALSRDGVPHWNPSVNRATHTVAELLSARALELGGKAACAVLISSLALAPVTTHASTLVISRSPVLGTAPIHLPPLAFHDLIFGKELGRGAFASVRYAKVIIKGSVPSKWPEVAVKVIPRATLLGCTYARAAAREVAVLSLLVHPGCVRLLGAFRWRGAVLLTLELASEGDLHDLLLRGGALDEQAVRFFTAELVAALAHLHEVGFAFGDVKPENVVIVPPPPGGTCGYHVKLTDFAASRPINAEGTTKLSKRRSLLATLRDGDWRTMKDGLGLDDEGTVTAVQIPPAPTASAARTPQFDEDENAVDDGGDDERFEGTDEYQAPEAATRGGAPSLAGDAWALGLTVFQMFSGGRHPSGPLWPLAEAEAAGHGGAVRFDAANTDYFPQGTPKEARAFIRALMHPNPQERLGSRSFADILCHEWLAPLGDATLLHASAVGPSLASPLAGGSARAAAPDARWARRHASTLWLPLPQAQPLHANTAVLDHAPVREREWGLTELARSLILPNF